MSAPVIEHDPARHRFVARVDGGEAQLVYREYDDGTLDLQHTEVPEAARGGHVGAALAEAAVAHARAHGVRLIATCPYVRRWLDRHPGAADVFSPR
jgi:predicted GNAT family acetyltransferase